MCWNKPCLFIQPKGHTIAVDMRGNILVAVFNDNAIHLLDQTLTFQKLLMTAEDGLQRPTSVALDAEGYLYVGCKDGQIHVMNYQYLLNTKRQTRLEIEHSKEIPKQMFYEDFCPKFSEENWLKLGKTDCFKAKKKCPTAFLYPFRER